MAQQAGQSAVRTAILDAATRLLVSEGPAALTVRRIAGEVGCSTKVIYTMFGGKEGLVEALWLEGFARFGEALGRVPRGDDPLVYLTTLGRAYRAYAVAEPHYYRVMFEGITGFKASDSATEVARGTFAFPVEAVSECMRAGVFAEGDPVEIADTLWMSVHGVVSLELAGFFTGEEAEARLSMLIGALLRSYGTAQSPSDERTVHDDHRE
ncbi:TetR/AcrR family transcriptional regulator [Sphaerisporangium sp. TRM90804]|uniref:TetR/AcrR family transcriptional regulator n=1 Tax=Sphaerisporangium sp. TRM90804 TaxID=3031113 RepID=UPI0024497E3D|nr:TetR/AcrR family transcriptional regulator [Sphaerisporangium sp. TRM90804]MDH2427339.1 TetR/AcrR family transcriptional regulator [Sphaerisporangium sp. TRM90804]